MIKKTKNKRKGRGPSEKAKWIPHPALLAGFLLFGLYIAPAVIVNFENTGDIELSYSGEYHLAVTWLVISILVVIAFVVLNCIFFFRLWQLAEASDLRIRKHSPGKAIAFLFIPLYGFFWVYTLIGSLALHLDHMRGRRIIHLRLLKYNIYLIGVPETFIMLATLLEDPFVSTVLTVLGFISLVIFMLMSTVTYYSFCKCARELQQQKLVR
ncbi:MAG: hypothetical protein GY800_14225 [Planctomycetes bacterium]|nr:hypothetical protein [Planctomycetota bacterium]